MSHYPRVASFKNARRVPRPLRDAGRRPALGDEAALAAPDSPLAQPAGGLAAATASPSSRWRAGTASATAARRSSPCAAGSTSAERGEADLGRRGGRGAPDGRANPQPAGDRPRHRAVLGGCGERCSTHARRHGRPTALVGLQLTHPGAARGPTRGAPAPRLALTITRCSTRASGWRRRRPSQRRRDGRADRTTSSRAAVLAQEAGFEFVDVKHCHGYLLHEFLVARARPAARRRALAGRPRLHVAIDPPVREAPPPAPIGVRLIGLRRRARTRPARWRGRGR